MTKSTSRNIFVLALVGGLPTILLLGSTARAQYRVSNMDGHALDANNRLGSGGFNTQTGNMGGPNLNDNVLTGNVSGLNYFHGNSQTFDPNVFQGNTGSAASDRLNAIAAPVNLAKPNNGTPNYTTYYNTSQLVAPPPANYVPAQGGQGYIPAPAVSPLTPSADTRVNTGDLINNDVSQSNLPTPGELNVVGPVDPSGNQSMYSMSPLYGVRPQDQGGNPNDNSFLSKTTNSRTTPADRSTMDQSSIQQMRNELNKTVLPADQTGQPPVTPGAVNLSQSQQITDTPSASSNLSGTTPLTSTVTNQQLGGDLASGESVQNQLIIAPAKQSKQLAELEKRYANSNQKLTDVQASDLYNAQVRAQATKSKPGDATAQKATKPLPGTGMGDTATPMAADKTAPASTPAIKPILKGPDNTPTEQPYIITSLAAGMPASGLATVMKNAEEDMRQGKFTEAVAGYETAEEVAPNNPFVYLGRGFAELGASYYGKADLDLGRAITSEPALLSGRYDLKGFLGEDRLNFVQKDLQDIADHEKGARPLVLLAYIAHNTGDDAAAARDLNDANTRGGYNKLVGMMQSAWGLKSAAK